MHSDTDLGGAGHAFPPTRHSIIAAVNSNDAPARAKALDAVVAAYWKPIYKYIRLRGHKENEDAKDLTQSFLAQVLEKNYLQSFDPAKARFRTFLRVCLDRFLGHEHEAVNRLKRGGGVQTLSLDFQSAEDEVLRHEPEARDDVDEFFRKEWLRSVFTQAVDELRRSCKASDKVVLFDLFRRYDLEGPQLAKGPSYADLAEEFQIPVTQVTNYLSAARKQFRAILLDRLREATASEEEFEEETRRLSGTANFKRQ